MTTRRAGARFFGVGVFVALAANSASAAITDNLVLHYELDETTAGPVVNSAGSPDGTNNGATINQPGRAGSAYRFDGAGDYVDTNTSTLIPATGDFTILMWINTTAPHSTQGHLFGNNAGQDGRANLMVQNGNLGFFLEDFGEFDSGTDVVDGTWRHVGVRRSSNVFSFIIDGSIDTPFGSSGANVATDADWRLGRRVNNNQFHYDGLMDDVGVWDRALNRAEISGIYEAGLSGKDLSEATPATMPALVADTNNDRVAMYEVDGTTWTFKKDFAAGAYDAANLGLPLGLALDDSGNVYIGEQKDGGRVLRFDSDGNYIDTVATEGVDFTGRPDGLTIGPDGNLYMSVAFGDNSDRVYKIDLSTDTVSTFIPQTAAGYALDNPRGIAFASDGHLYLTSRNTGEILKFNGTTGERMARLAAPDRPQALFWDADGGVLLAGVNGGDSANSADRINSYTLAGASTLVFDDATDPAFIDLERIAGNIYATDYKDGRVVQVTNGTITNAVTGLDGPGHILALPREVSAPPPPEPPKSVPEPATVCLLTLASAGLCSYLRRSKTMWTERD